MHRLPHSLFHRISVTALHPIPPHVQSLAMPYEVFFNWGKSLDWDNRDLLLQQAKWLTRPSVHSNFTVGLYWANRGAVIVYTEKSLINHRYSNRLEAETDGFQYSVAFFDLWNYRASISPVQVADLLLTQHVQGKLTASFPSCCNCFHFNPARCSVASSEVP